jgi:hypothetical protein
VEIAPRQLTHEERGVLALLLSRDFPGVEDLRSQSREVVVVGRCECGCPSIALAHPGTSSRGKSTLTPFEGRVVGHHGAPPIELLLFTDDGQLSYLELVWYGESAPGSWPHIDAIDLVEIDR